MKYIITEAQYERVISKTALFWVRRRYDLVIRKLSETEEMMYADICRIDDYESFERKFFSVLMDCLHPYFYDDENIDNIKYDEMFDLLKDAFYVDCTEFYFAGQEKC